jgi:hypothetical protein
MEPQNAKTEKFDSSKWYSNQWKMYNTLSFESGNTIVIGNHTDSIFRYKYILDRDTLWFITDEKHRIPNPIKLHNKEELIFESFMDTKKELRYSRINKILK